MLDVTQLRPGQYVTVAGGGFAGKFIRRVEHSRVAHVYLYVGPQSNGFNIVQGEPGGVRYGHVSDYDASTSYPSLTPLTDEQASAIIAEGLASVDKGYGWVADFFIGLKDLHLWVPKWIWKLRSIASNRQCAQLVDMCYAKADVHLFDDGRAPGSVSPFQLYRKDYPA